ncbi:class I SAM-dependent methyltransferase [Nocardioides dongkuii]|uniref:class I SAM-dependent methyltransferase n=1 Tax=Nocardioides dongkuii TaxID=2760089 RepID=UPI0015FA51DD|nr:class I SAM-dependent methyltransferase [Nocardioides dongkuii]
MSEVLDRWFTRWYPLLMSISERGGQADVRAAQLGRAVGRTLEVGVGSGLSLPHYGSAVTELVLVEPDRNFRTTLRRTLETVGATRPTTVLDADVERLPFEDASFDTVTASFTFCSVRRPDVGLAELHRVLRPGGRFLFHEHVRGHGLRARVQDLLAPLQAALSGGCRPDRDFAGTVRASAFRIDELVPDRMPRAFPTVSPVVHGVASRTTEDAAGERS